MQLEGQLSGFPLPEVLLFLGNRTGCLRLYAVPKFGEMNLYLAKGHAHALHLGGTLLTEKTEIINALSVIVETGEGRFDFDNETILPEPREHPFMISDLVMSMVLHVDRKLSLKRTAVSPNDLYVLETPAPKIWIDPNLKMFYDQGHEWLKEGAQIDELAEELGLENDIAMLSITYLRQLGFVKIVVGAEAEKRRQARVQKDISVTSNRYKFAAEASDLIMRTGKLIQHSGKLWKPPGEKKAAPSPTL